MDQHVEDIYLRGDADALIAICRSTGATAEDGGAYQALRLLARLRDPRAMAFCQTTTVMRNTDAA